MQLLSRGAESAYLTGNPEFSSYVKKYERYLPFALDTVEIPVDARFGLETAGAEYTCLIPHDTCDMIIDAHLMLTWAAKDVTRQLPQDSAHAVVDYVDLRVGGQTVARWPGALLSLYEDISRNAVTYTVDDYLAGKYVDFSGAVTQDIRRGGEFGFRLPLLGSGIAKAFPLCAIRHHALEVVVRTSRAIIRTGKCTASVRIRGAYLDGTHRARFTDVPLAYVYTQPQSQYLPLAKTPVRLRHPVYALCLAVRSSDTERLTFKRCVTSFSFQLAGDALFEWTPVVHEYQFAQAFSRYPAYWHFLGRSLSAPRGSVNMSRFREQDVLVETDGSEGDNATRTIYALSWQILYFRDGLCGIPYS